MSHVGALSPSITSATKPTASKPAAASAPAADASQAKSTSAAPAPTPSAIVSLSAEGLSKSAAATPAKDNAPAHG